MTDIKGITLRYFRDIRFWIVLFFIVRLIGITNPPLESSHNWRQTTVTMVARNFQEVDNSILYPRIDIAGEKTGITGMEFPLLNYGIYLTAEIFGYHHWYGRLINLIISSIGIFYFFLLVRQFFDERTAYYAALILLFSAWFVFSRKIMPDTFSVSLIIIGLYHGANYMFKTGGWLKLFYFGLLIMLGVLSKLPSGYLLIILIPWILSKSIAIQKRILFTFITGLALLPSLWWYFIWVPYLVKHFGFWHFFMGKSINAGINELLENLNLTLSRFYHTAFGFSGFVVFVIGLVKATMERKRTLLILFALSSFSFIIIMLKAGFTFAHHSYYIVPFVPVMALVAGYGLSKLRVQWLAPLLAGIIFIECAGDGYRDFFIKKELATVIPLESSLDKVSSRKDLILINSNYIPTPMYFAHRKGWINSNEFISHANNVDSLSKLGLKYIVILNSGFGSPNKLSYPKVIDCEEFEIYSVSAN